MNIYFLLSHVFYLPLAHPKGHTLACFFASPARRYINFGAKIGKILKSRK